VCDDRSCSTRRDAVPSPCRHLVDGITIEIALVGGITKARLIRDVAVQLDLQVTAEDAGGVGIDATAMAHLSVSTPNESRAHTVNFHNGSPCVERCCRPALRRRTMTAPMFPASD
jgi:L-alanine-DL-glutamate epimerase-like enolase superfamily enzyme